MQLNDTTNLKGIKQDLYFNGKFGAATFSQNDLNRIINKYYKIVQEDIRSVNEDFFLVSTKADLQLYSNNNGSYSYPADYEKMKSLWVATNPANSASPQPSEYVRCLMLEPNAITDPSYAFSNPTAVLYGTFFLLFPQFINTAIYPVTGGVKLYYIPIQTELVNDTDTPLIFSDYHDVVTWGSLIDLAPRLENKELLKLAKEMFTQRRKEMKQDAAQRVLDISPEYVEGQGSRGGWAFPFGKTGI